MDLYRLRCIVSLAKLRNVTRAAEENYVAQSTMSSTISAVEAELGANLFVRTNRSVTLTPEGECFVAAAEEIVRRYDRALAELKAIKCAEDSQLTIGFNAVTLGSRAAQVLLPFQKAHPDLTLNLRKHSLSKLAECLVDGRADIAFGNQFEARKNASFKYIVIAKTRPCVYVRFDHPLATLQKATVADLVGERLLCACTEAEPHAMSAAACILSDAGIPYTSDSLVSNEETIFSMVETGLGVYPASTWYRKAYEDRVACVPLELDVEAMEIVVMWADSRFDDYAAELASFARKVFAG